MQVDMLSVNRLKMECAGVNLRANHERFKNMKVDLETCISQFQGIASGIIADNVVNDDELAFVWQWYHVYKNYKYNFPISELDRFFHQEYTSVDEMKKKLVGQLSKICCGKIVVDPLFDVVDNIDYNNKKIAFTGVFVTGLKRKDAAQFAIDKGAIFQNSITLDTDVIVVGEEGSTAWKNEGIGDKLQKSILNRGRYGKPLIITETVYLTQLAPDVIDEYNNPTPKEEESLDKIFGNTLNN